MIQIHNYEEKDRSLWDQYVTTHSEGACYHLSAWKRAVERAYGHRAHYLLAWYEGSREKGAQSLVPETRSGEHGAGSRGHGGQSLEPRIVGVLPLFHLRNFAFGNQLVSLPFCDYGGILADTQDATQALLQKAMDLAASLNNATVEFRNGEKIPSNRLASSSHKVRMALDLDKDADNLWKGFDAKLRSQIRKPGKEGLTAKLGGVELLNDFYQVFSFNMRDLGSPVHSKKLVRCVLEEFGEAAKLQVVYKDKTAMAGGLILCFRDTVFIPWASTIRHFNRLSPNMMLYWNFLKYAADNGFRKFDFGRSSPDEGTYKFKEQWGAKPTPLYWQYGMSNGVRTVADSIDKNRYASFVSVWKRLPLPLANIMGPYIRKHISL